MPDDYLATTSTSSSASAASAAATHAELLGHCRRGTSDREDQKNRDKEQVTHSAPAEGCS